MARTRSSADGARRGLAASASPPRRRPRPRRAPPPTATSYYRSRLRPEVVVAPLALELGEPLLEGGERGVLLLLVGVERGPQVRDLAVDAGHQAIRRPDVGPQLLDLEAEVGAVRLRAWSRPSSTFLSWLICSSSDCSFVLTREFSEVDVLAQGLALALGGGPEAALRGEPGREQRREATRAGRRAWSSDHLHWNSHRRSLSSPRPGGLGLALGHDVEPRGIHAEPRHVIGHGLRRGARRARCCTPRCRRCRVWPSR